MEIWVIRSALLHILEGRCRHTRFGALEVGEQRELRYFGPESAIPDPIDLGECTAEYLPIDVLHALLPHSPVRVVEQLATENLLDDGRSIDRLVLYRPSALSIFINADCDKMNIRRSMPTSTRRPRPIEEIAWPSTDPISFNSWEHKMYLLRMLRGLAG